MRQTPRDILVFVLQQEECWDSKTREIRMSHVYQLFARHLEARWYDRVFFPGMNWINHALRAFNVVPADAFEVQIMGWDIEQKVLWVTDPNWNDWVMDALEPWIEKKWITEDWGLASFTKEDALALNITPSMVPPKEGQPALF